MIDALCRILQDQTLPCYARAGAVKRLGQFGKDAQAVMSVVKEALEDQNPWIRVEAAGTVYGLNRSLAPELLPVLVAVDEETDGKDESGEFYMAQYRIREVIEAMAADVRPQLQEMAKRKPRAAGYIARNAHRIARCGPRLPVPQWKREIQYKLGRCIDVEFVEVPSRTALQHIGRLAGIKIKFARSYDDSDSPVTLRLTSASAEMALSWVGRLARVYSAKPTRDGLLLGGHEGPM